MIFTKRIVFIFIAYQAATSACADDNWRALRNRLESSERRWLKRFGLQTNRRVNSAQNATDTVYTRVPREMIERLLKQMNYGNFQRTDTGQSIYYSFRNKDNYRVRLWLLFNQSNLMLSADFPETSLSKINQYNVGQFLVRAVLYSRGNTMETVFESNLSCSDGVTETMIRYFISRYDNEIQRFAEKMFNGRQE